MLDNVDIAILSKVNQLADRYGFKPYEFVATVRLDEPTRGTILSFESFPAGGRKEERFQQMLEALGVEEDYTLKSAARIIDALDAALIATPPRRSEKTGRTP